MALNTFGWTGAEVIEDKASGRVVAGVSLTVYTDITKATQVTALYGKDGSALPGSTIVSDGKGRFGFKASDTYSLLYVWDGTAEDPWPVAAHEALDQGMASHAQAVADAQAAADSAAASATEAHNAANLVGAPADTAVKALVDNAASQTRASLNSTFAPKSNLLAAGLPSIFAHRGAGVLAPENTSAAFNVTMAQGGSVETDVWMAADGGLVVFHDQTLDRITTNTGTVTTFTSAELAAVQVKAGQATGWPAQPVMLWAEALQRFGGRGILMPETKTASVLQPLCASIVKAGMQNSVLVQCGSTAAADTIAYGCIPAPLIGDGVAASTPAGLAAQGVKYAVCDGDAITAATVTAYHAAGIKLIAYSLSSFITRVRRDAHLAKGIDSLIVDDVPYLSRTAPITATDPWRVGVKVPGVITANGAADFATLPGKWGFSDVVSGTRMAIHGWACPVPAANSGNGYRITVDFEYGALSTDQNGALHVWAGFATDNATPPWSGYQFSMARSGYSQVFKWTNGTQTLLASGSTATAAAAGVSGTATMVIEVTPTGVSEQRTSGGTFTKYAAADTAFRGGYIGLGSNGTEGYFKNITIAAL